MRKNADYCSSIISNFVLRWTLNCALYDHHQNTKWYLSEEYCSSLQWSSRGLMTLCQGALTQGSWWNNTLQFVLVFPLNCHPFVQCLQWLQQRRKFILRDAESCTFSSGIVVMMVVMKYTEEKSDYKSLKRPTNSHRSTTKGNTSKYRHCQRTIFTYFTFISILLKHWVWTFCGLVKKIVNRWQRFGFTMQRLYDWETVRERRMTIEEMKDSAGRETERESRPHEWCERRFRPPLNTEHRKAT